MERRNEIRTERRSQLELEAEWKARLKREQDEQTLREAQRQRMASSRHGRRRSLPAQGRRFRGAEERYRKETIALQRRNATTNSASDLYSAAMKSGLLGAKTFDQNGQTSKEDFFNQDIKDLGYLPNQVVPQFRPYELKRGSVIPATMITGLNSDLPGRISAQVSQNVYACAPATGCSFPRERSCLVAMTPRYHSARSAYSSFGRLIFPTDQHFRSAACPARMPRDMEVSRTRSIATSGAPSALPRSLPSSARGSICRCGEFDTGHAGYGFRCSAAEFCRIVRPCCRADDLEKSQCAAHHQDTAGLQIQRACRSGCYFPVRIPQLEQTSALLTTAEKLNWYKKIQSCMGKIFLLEVTLGACNQPLRLYSGAISPTTTGTAIRDCNLVAFIPSFEGGHELDQWFERLIEQVALAHGEPSVKTTLEKLSREAGFGAYAYLNLQAETQTAISNYDVEWQQRYLEQSYALIDPVVRKARDQLEAFGGPTKASRKMSKERRNFYAEAGEFGIRSGITIPIKTGFGRMAMLTWRRKRQILP